MDEETIKVEPNVETISCDGGEDSLGHPTVYYTFDEEDKIVCNYCGKTYIKNKD
tara:strand:- start:385 stop:546 length:162 start_codon:yes stop_codon:yes gene_type:complete